MIETIEFKSDVYPKFQSEGNAAKFAIPFAQAVCRGVGYDIGCNRPEWCMPGAIPIDPLFTEYDGLRLPQDKYGKVDFIFSSHCLEHIEKSWYSVLTYWYDNLKPGGVLFLYLPDFSQVYWRPWNNSKHVHTFAPYMLRSAFVEGLKMKNVFVSGVDLNNSFMVMGEK